MELKEKLRAWAKEYNTPSFIDSDPIQFPRKYIHSKKDAEIRGILTALISYGRREQIIAKAKVLNDMFNNNPYLWIVNGQFREDIPYNHDSFYRCIENAKMIEWCSIIQMMLFIQGSIEQYIKISFAGQSPQYGLSVAMGFNPKSANKRIAMFLRWMVRNDGIVDLGLWKDTDSKDLVIPLDTHVSKMALALGITQRKTADIKTALEITEYMKSVFPDDPLLGDFALFGYGINNDKAM